MDASPMEVSIYRGSRPAAPFTRSSKGGTQAHACSRKRPPRVGARIRIRFTRMENPEWTPPAFWSYPGPSLLLSRNGPGWRRFRWLVRDDRGGPSSGGVDREDDRGDHEEGSNGGGQPVEKGGRPATAEDGLRGPPTKGCADV